MADTMNKDEDKQTRFEQDLKAFFPDIWELDQLGKEDAHVWKIIALIIEMRQDNATGWIKIHYNKGWIDDVFQDKSILTGHKKRPGY